MHQFVARQPILDRQLKLVGYELLFRSGTNNVFPNLPGNKATSQLVSNLFFSLNLDTLTDHHPAYINFDQHSLQLGIPTLLPKENVIIEVLEHVEPTREVLDALERFKSAGYRIALDDFVPSEDMLPLVALADVIKLDIKQSGARELELLQRQVLQSQNRSVKLLAEKVETQAEFDHWLGLEMDLFQGYFFSRPQMLDNQVLAPSKLHLLQLLQVVNQTPFELKEAESVIERDAALIYKLLRYINSARFGLASEITSLNQAVVYLGEKKLKQFINLLAVAGLASNKPDALMQMAMFRAKYCELLAQSRTDTAKLADHAFLVGLFSLLDCMLSRPMDQLLAELPLAKPVSDALLHHKGRLAFYLSLAQAFEQGNWSIAEKISRKLSLDFRQLPEQHLSAIRWLSEADVGAT